MGAQRDPMGAQARFVLATAFLATAAAALMGDPALQAIRVARLSILADSVGVRIAPSEGKGLGAFATKRIAEFTQVGDYIGELFSQRDIDARFGPLTEQRASLWNAEDDAWAERRRKLGINTTGAYIFKIDDDLYVDGEDETRSCWTRYLNHGSPNNLQVRTLARGMDGKPRVWFYALRDIEVGEELTIDYGADYWSESETFK